MAFQPHSFMFQAHREDQDLHLSSAPSLSTLPPHRFHGLLSGGGEGGHGAASFMMKRSVSFSGVHHHHDHHNENDVDQCCELEGGMHGGDDELSDDGSQVMIGEKKKRLNVEQVRTLEKSFELGNKLEPERKIQLAKALGLQPRQIAIWFQNRRARWKTKQLEKDYDALKKQFDSLKSDNDALLAHNKKLHAQLSNLKGRDSSNEGGFSNLKKDNEDQGCWSNGSDHNSNCDINLEISRTPAASSQINGRNFFPSTNLRPSNVTQLLQGSSRSDIQGLKLDHHHHQMVQEESFCNMFNAGINEDHQGFWPWPDQHHQFQ